MKIIVGLGNPGPKYASTRHNIGFLAIDQIRDELIDQAGFSPFNLNARLESEISEGKLNEEKIILAKPQTFMNESGRAVQKIIAFYKTAPEDVWVIQDDKDLPIGKVRVRENGSSGGHNGIASIITNVGPEFRRFKIGIAPKDARPGRTIQDPSEFVLGKIAESEMEAVNNAIIKVAELIQEKLK